MVLVTYCIKPAGSDVQLCPLHEIVKMGMRSILYYYKNSQSFVTSVYNFVKVWYMVQRKTSTWFTISKAVLVACVCVICIAESLP